MVTIRHPSVHLADAAGIAADDVLRLSAAAIRDVLALADFASSEAGILVIAASGEPPGRDPAEPALESSFGNRLVRELVWEPGLPNAIPIVVGLLGEPVLTTGVLTAHGLLLADRLEHAMLVVMNLGPPGAVGAAAFLVSAEERDGLLIGSLDVIPHWIDEHAQDRSAAPASADAITGLRTTLLGVSGQQVETQSLSAPPPGAGMVELFLPGADPSVQGVLESVRRMIDAMVTHGDRAVLIEGNAQGLGGLMLERLRQ